MRSAVLVLPTAIAAFASAAQAQAPDARTDAQVYFDAEGSLRRVEDEADCGGQFIPWALHRVINMRWDLRRHRQFARRDPAYDRLVQELDARERLCISSVAIAPNLRSARRDISLLRQRARRAGQWPIRRGN